MAEKDLNLLLTNCLPIGIVGRNSSHGAKTLEMEWWLRKKGATFQLAAYKFSEIRSTISFVTILVAKTSLYVRNDLARGSDNLVGSEIADLRT